MSSLSVAVLSAASPRTRLASWQHVMGWGMAGSLLTAAVFVAKDLGSWAGFTALTGTTSLVPSAGLLLNLLIIAGGGLALLALIAGLVSMLMRDRPEQFDRHLVLWAPAMVLLASLI